MAESTKNLLVLIDGHSNVHRAFHAIKESLTNSKGEPTSAVYGFLTMFFRLQKQLQYTHVAVVFDPPGSVFREDLYPEYKANRPPMPEELRVQERRIREVLTILGVPVVELPGFEADDVLGALALRAVEHGGEALVCSVDKDLLQLVRPGVRIWREHLNKTETLDEAGVFEKLGVRPDQVAAYLGLVGDSSDNIPGVPGVGPKTAAQLLADFGNMEAILAAASGLKQKKLSENLQTHAADARLSEQLATLVTDCVQEFDWERFRWEFRPSKALRSFYQEMEFQSFLDELGGETVDQRDTDYRVVRTRAGLEQVAAALRAAGEFAIDTETTDLDPFLAQLVGVSLSWKSGQAVYLPVGHTAGEEQLSLQDLREVLGPVLADPSLRRVAHHWDFDYKILKHAGLPVGPVDSDTMVASYLVNPEQSASLRLKDMAVQWLGIRMTEIRELIGEGDDLVTMASVTVEDSGRYACQDADVTLQLHHHFREKVAQAGMTELFAAVEMPLTPILAEMELEGVSLDTAHFRRLSKEAERVLERLTLEAYQLAGRQFNLSSPKQVGQLLFEELKLPAQKKGKSGAYSTDVSVLEDLEALHPLPAKLLEFRQQEKLKNTYIDPLPLMLHPRTGKLHTSLNQTIAATGRLSSSNPNLQNIPIRTEAGRAIRAGFVPRRPDWVLVSADYSQIELRILAHLSRDPALCEAFRSGGDVHTLTASKVFRVDPAAVTGEQRNAAKAINFGIIYGMSDFRLSKDLGIGKHEAKTFIEEYFRIYAGVQRFIEETKEQARRDRAVTTILGRRRFVPDINSRNANLRFQAERIAVNTRIQGTSADMIKAAMIRVDRRLRAEGMAARMILQVHDELIFDAPQSEAERLMALAREEMTAALPLSVPIRVDAGAGKNWAEC